MSLWIDRKYLLLLSPKLELFKQKNTNLYTCRCPYCGDSQKIKSKTRGFIYSKKDNYFYTCFNCGKGTTLKNLLSFLNPSLEQEYVLENYTERVSFSSRKIIETPSIPKFETHIKKIDLPKLSELDNSNLAKKYALSRKLPNYCYDFLYYAEDFKAFVESVSDKELDKTSPRLIIPFFSRSGDLIAFQGRALDSYSMRYITVKLDKESNKIFGLDRVNTKQKIYVTEGPFDSLFLDNCVATADSNLAAAGNLFDKSNLILVPDNEPRNKNIVKNIEKSIENGFSVCLFPDNIKEKDINDMILNGFTPEKIRSIINMHTYEGLRARIEFSQWRKI